MQTRFKWMVWNNIIKGCCFFLIRCLSVDWKVQYRFCEGVIAQRDCWENDARADTEEPVVAVMGVQTDGWRPALLRMSCRCPSGHYYMQGWRLEIDSWNYNFTCDRVRSSNLSIELLYIMTFQIKMIRPSDLTTILSKAIDSVLYKRSDPTRYLSNSVLANSVLRGQLGIRPQSILARLDPTRY